MRTSLGSTRDTVPVTMVPILSSKAVRTASFSASRRRWITTCLAVPAATRPNEVTLCFSSTISPILEPFLASFRGISLDGL